VGAPEAVIVGGEKSSTIHNLRVCRSNQTLFGSTIHTDAMFQGEQKLSAHQFIS
jgi:hypothetical protein